MTATLSATQQHSIDEATDRLSLASRALNGFADLLTGYNPKAGALNAEYLGALLEPIRGEVSAALDELQHVPAH